MVSQSVTEGILRFVLERNGMPDDNKSDEALKVLVEENIISQRYCEAFSRIRKSFRNDVHHMNQSVYQVPFREFAKRNMDDLATIEGEIFACSYGINGELIPRQPKYWNMIPERDIPIFIRGII
jgi:hypothetical protein